MVRVRAGRAYDIRDVDSLREAFRTGDDYGGRGAKVQISRHGERVAATFVPNPVRDTDGILSTFSGEVGDGSPDPGFEPFTVLAVVEARRRCSHPDDTWARFTAKVGIGLAHLLRRSTAELDDGFGTADALSSDGYDALVDELRRIAFGSECDAVHEAEPDWIATGDGRGPLHTVGLLKRDAHAVIVVQLFGELRYELAAPGVDVRHAVQLSVGRQN